MTQKFQIEGTRRRVGGEERVAFQTVIIAENEDDARQLYAQQLPATWRDVRFTRVRAVS